MEIFSEQMSVDMGSWNLIGLPKSNRIVLCIHETRKFFSLPTSTRLMDSGRTFTLSVYDRKVAEGLKVRRTTKCRWWCYEVEYKREGQWETIDLDGNTVTALKRLFRTSGKKYLYVVLTEDI